jgi:hypothetical protein
MNTMESGHLVEATVEWVTDKILQVLVMLPPPLPLLPQCNYPVAVLTNGTVIQCTAMTRLTTVVSSRLEHLSAFVEQP